jgi:hypothetical protein
MIWLLTRPVVWPAKASARSMAVGYKAGRLVGYRRITVFLLGVAVGLLVAPFPGRDLRALLRERLSPASEPLPLPASTSPWPPVPARRESDMVDLTDE